MVSHPDEEPFTKGTTMRLILFIFLSFGLSACGTQSELKANLEESVESNASGTEQDNADTQEPTQNNGADESGDENEEPNGPDTSDEIEDADDSDNTAEDNTDASTNPEEDNTNPSNPVNGPILVLGDSVMAWNVEEGTSIGHVIGDRTGQSVTIRAVSGAHFASDEDDDIRSQYVEGDWSWVVFTGGGNDLNDKCECGDCSGVLNGLLSSDGSSGAVAEAVDVLRDSGVSVLFLTYYDLPPTADFGFANCGDESQALDERAAAMAQSREGVYWLDMGQVVTPNDLSAFDEDHVHPSERGSELIGELVADFIMAQ